MTAPKLKDPNAVVDYKVDWSTWLAENEVIQTSTVIVDAGITKDSADHDTTTVTVWLSGGTAGQTYRVTSRITTNQDRTDDRSMRIHVTDR